MSDHSQLAEIEAIYNTAPIGLCVFDTQFRYLRINDRLAEFNGVPAARHIGRTTREVVPALADWTESMLREVIATGRPIFGVEFTGTTFAQSDMQRTWIVHWLPLLDAAGSVTGVSVVVEEVTQRRRAEEALQKAHDELEEQVRRRTAELVQANQDLDIFRKFAEASGQAFAMANTNNQVIYANAAMLRLCGEEKLEDVLGKSFLSYYPGELRQRLEGQMLAGVEREGQWVGELAFLAKTGEPRSVLANGFQIRDETGAPVAQAVVMTDITQRKRVEEALRQAHEALRREHRTLKHLLQASDRERQTIAYDIHDGLAQQLAGAIMQFQVFEQLKDQDPNEAAKAHDGGVTLLRQAHFECRRLIAGVRPPILDELGVVAAVGHLVNEQGRRKRPKIDYHTRVDFDRLVPILENAIYRIAQEALTNACRHSRSEKVRVSLLQREGRVRIEIRDWGTGFDTKAVPGERFGLEGIRQRARLLGGKCSIRSSPGQGTRITVELPVALRE